VAAAFLLASRESRAAGPSRWHFVLGGGSEISILFERTEAGDATGLLVKVPGGRFVFSSTQDPSGRDSTESIRRLPDGEELSRRLVLARFEGVPGCEGIAPPEACVVLAGPNGSIATGFGAFSDERAARTRARAAALVSPAFRDALFGLAPLLPSVAEFGSYAKDFLNLVWPERFTRRQSVRKGERTKGCDFDATFGFPCDARAREREEKRFGGPVR
jgi:hypothetical protein